jgi:DNA polymerase III alpha subunit
MARRIVAARPFADLTDCCRRTRLPRRLIEHLILAGAFDGWGQARRVLLWELGMLHYEVEELDLPIPSEDVDLPPLEADGAHDLGERCSDSRPSRTRSHAGGRY